VETTTRHRLRLLLLLQLILGGLDAGSKPEMLIRDDDGKEKQRAWWGGRPAAGGRPWPSMTMECKVRSGRELEDVRWVGGVQYWWMG